MFYDRSSSEKLTEGIKQRSRKPWKNHMNPVLIVVVAFLLILTIVALVMYVRSRSRLADLEEQVKTLQADPAQASREKTEQLVDQVGKLIFLPEDEQPTVATVTDLDKLRDQPFFAKAQLGDKVLIYQRAKKAILFRPSENKIIELAPLSSGIDNNEGSIPSSSGR